MRDRELRTAITNLLREPLAPPDDADPPADPGELADVLSALRRVAVGDPQITLREKLVIARLTSSPHSDDQQRCLECMYFLVHRRWCDLPELSLPVEPDWWCRLWRG